VASEFFEYNLDLPEDAKSDCEINACKRLMEKIKKYFKRMKFIVYLDGLYPSRPIIKKMLGYKWDYIIYLKKKTKLAIHKVLDANRNDERPIPNQATYRERRQGFYFSSNILFDPNDTVIVNAVSCHESWEEVNHETAQIITKHSEHRWISNLTFNINNVHELCNLGARKRCLIEDSINTEKNRGYYYESLKSISWAAIKCYHYLMRLGHAINAITEFTRVIKKFIKEEGVTVILDLILETLSNPWLTPEWFEMQKLKRARLLF
jgi:hypothetical protein